MKARSPCFWAGASGRWSATHSHISARFHPLGTAFDRTRASPEDIEPRTVAPWTSCPRPTPIRGASAVRAWLAEHPRPTARELAEAGYVAPHWPPPFGLDADPTTS